MCVCVITRLGIMETNCSCAREWNHYRHVSSSCRREKQIKHLITITLRTFVAAIVALAAPIPAKKFRNKNLCFFNSLMIGDNCFYNLLHNLDAIHKLLDSFVEIWLSEMTTNVFCMFHRVVWKSQFYQISVIQWNLSVTTTSIIKCITCDLFSNVF